MLFEKSAVDGENKVGSKDIIKPVLLVMAHAERAGIKSLPTSKIRELVRQSIVLSDQDQAPLKNRSDSRFDQIVRNLISHNTLLNLGYVSYGKPRVEARPSSGGMVLTKRGKAYLATQCLNLIGVPDADQVAVVEGTGRTTEDQIAIPALLILAKLNADRDGPVSTTELRKVLKSSLSVSPEDVEKLRNRTDSKIDQTIRNLISHATLEREGWASRKETGLEVTQSGLVRLLSEFLEVLPAPDFNNSEPAATARRPRVGA